MDTVAVVIINTTGENVSVWSVQENLVNTLAGAFEPPLVRTRMPVSSTYSAPVLPGTELRFRVAVTGALLGTYVATAAPVQTADIAALIKDVPPRLPRDEWDQIRNSQRNTPGPT